MSVQSRSRIHMLNVAAARLEQSYANAKLIADLREAAKVEAQRRADGMRDDDELSQTRRIERQRTLIAMLPDIGATDRLKSAILQRAYDCMWDGDTAGCDALIEFLPSAEVEKMFSAWESDQMVGDHERSPFYQAKDFR